jgi:hypothetical protein
VIDLESTGLDGGVDLEARAIVIDLQPASLDRALHLQSGRLRRGLHVSFSSFSQLGFSRERFTELQRPCHSDDEKIETVFQRSGSADVAHVL